MLRAVMPDYARDHESSLDHELVSEDELLMDDDLVAHGPRTVRRGSEKTRHLVRAGDVLARKYRVERVHAAGAQGLTLDAEHVELGQRVAFKLSSSNDRMQPESAARFLRGARLAAQLRNRHIARVVDLGTLDSGVPYSVTEHLSGTDLRGVLRVREWLPVSEAVDYVLQACEAIAEAHVNGYLHRNLKPSNLFLARETDGEASVKVLDFCIVQAPLEDAAMTSMSRSLVGSLAYLAPEQIRDPEGVDARADVWALGAVLHELLSGVPVYAAASAPGLFAAIAADAPASFAELRPEAEVPADLEAVVLRCLEKNRELRFAGVGELARQLAPFASERGEESVEQIVKILERRVRTTRSLNPPALTAPPPAKAATAVPVPAPVAPNRRIVELGILAVGVLGISIGIGAYLSLRNVQALLANRPAERAVVASLSPALTAAPAPTPASPVASVPPVVAVKAAPVAHRAVAKPATPAAAPPSNPDLFAADSPPVAKAAPAAKSGLFDDAN